MKTKCFIYDEHGVLEDTVTGKLLDLVGGVEPGTMNWMVSPHANMSVIYMGKGEHMPQEVLDIIEELKKNPNVVCAHRAGPKATFH